MARIIDPELKKQLVGLGGKFWGSIAGLVILGIVGLSVLAGCGSGKANEPFKDSGKSGRDTGPAIVGSMPDGFGNWSSKCMKGAPGIRIATLFHNDKSYGGIAMIQDPNCK